MTTREELEQTVFQNKRDAGVFEERAVKAKHANDLQGEIHNTTLRRLCIDQAADAQDKLKELGKQDER